MPDDRPGWTTENRHPSPRELTVLAVAVCLFVMLVVSYAGDVDPSEQASSQSTPVQTEAQQESVPPVQ